MSEVLIPTWIIPEKEEQEWMDEGSSVFGAAFAPGLAQRQSYGGLRLKLSRRHTVRAEEKAQLLSILRGTRGRYNTVRTKVHFAQRGSFNAAEVLSNGTFANGTTDWTSSSESTVTVNDRVARVTRNAVTASQIALGRSAADSITQYGAYALRAYVAAGRGAYTGLALYDSVLGGAGLTSQSAPGYLTNDYVPLSSTLQFGLADFATSGLSPGDYISVPYTSVARCALVDAGQNVFTFSDQFDNAAWTKTATTISANTGLTVAPDGTATADNIVETTANSAHYVSQVVTVGSGAHDRCLTIALKTNGRSHCVLQMDHATGSVSAYFNLSTGAVGNVSTGTGWANLRTFASNMGNGWWQFSIVANKTTAATSVTGFAQLATANGTSSYVGSASFGMFAWRGTISASSVPVRLMQTTAAATGGASQTGNAFYVKGLTASTNGLLLPDDIFEINGEIKHATAALNSDASGLGYLQFEPAMVRSAEDNDPIIIRDPMGKFLVSNLKIDNEFGTQAIVTYDLEHIYE